MCTSIQCANCRMRQGIQRQVTKQIDYRKLSKVLHLSHFEKGEHMKIHLKTFDLDTVPFANMMYIKKLKQKEDKVSESLPSFAILPKKNSSFRNSNPTASPLPGDAEQFPFVILVPPTFNILPSSHWTFLFRLRWKRTTVNLETMPCCIQAVFH